jgi:RNA polymerase sigma-70 factor (ECF subfamily)
MDQEGPARMSREEDLRTFFASSVQQNMDALYGVAVRLTRNGADAEDLVAESVARAWAAIDTLADRARFRPWMFRILRNGFISAQRRRAVRPAETPMQDLFSDEGEQDLTDFLLDQPEAFLAWWANPELKVANQALGEAISAAIDTLPECFRITVLLITVEGLGYDEAAELLGIPTGTVRSRMKRGRTMLQKALWQHASEAGLTVSRGDDGPCT